MLLLRCVLGLTFGLALVPSPTATAQQITLPDDGVVTGTIQTNVAGDRIHVFRGIPYAEPPVGDRRWTQATLQPLTGNVNATAFGPICYGDGRIDAQSSTLPASEDCLFLNVYAPATATNSESKLPVMVWIYGGGFVAGASNIYDGANLLAAARNDLVVVTLNYRLSVFGLLSSDTLKRQGTGVNYALRDQEVAFQWVQQHIGLFGGDATRVTAFGESAGAKSVFAHLISRGGSQQLFQRAILQSGTYTTAHDVPTTSQQNAIFTQLTTQLGCAPSSDAGTDAIGANGDQTTDAAVLRCLRAANTSAVWAAGGLLAWQPVVDGVFFLDAPLPSVLNGRLSRVPTIIGTNTDEGWTFTTAVTTAATVLPFVRTKFSLLTETELARVDELYAAELFASPDHRASQLYGDAIYVCPSEFVSLALAQRGDVTFRYRFNQTSTTFGSPLAVHTAEIRYVFNMVAGLAQDNATQAFVAAMQRYWTTFAASGSPNDGTGTTSQPPPNGCADAATVATTEDSGVFTWPPYDASVRQQIVLQASGLVVETTGAYMPLHAERCAFWNDVERRLSPSLAVA